MVFYAQVTITILFYSNYSLNAQIPEIWAKLAQQSEFAKVCDNQMGRSGQETYYLAVLYNFWQGVDCIYGL